MLKILLGNLLKSGTQQPVKIEDTTTSDKNENLILYGFSVIVLIIVVYFLAKSFK